MEDFIKDPSEELGALLNQMNLNPTEANILKKQYLAGEIFKQAVIEINDPTTMSRLLFDGVYVDPITSEIIELPAITYISNINTVYNVLFLLLQSR